MCVCVCVCVYRGFPGSSDGKESACNAGDLASIPELGRSLGEGNGNPLQLFLPGEFHGQRSLADVFCEITRSLRALNSTID